MLNVNMAQQYKLMADDVFNISKYFESLPEPELVKVFPAFIIGSFYNMLSETPLNLTSKAALLDYLIKASGINFGFNGFEIVLQIDKMDELGVLINALTNFRDGSENFWTAILTYSYSSSQVEVFDHFLGLFKNYIYTAEENLNENFPTAIVFAGPYIKKLEAELSRIEPLNLQED